MSCLEPTESKLREGEKLEVLPEETNRTPEEQGRYDLFHLAQACLKSGLHSGTLFLPFVRVYFALSPFFSILSLHGLPTASHHNSPFPTPSLSSTLPSPTVDACYYMTSLVEEYASTSTLSLVERNFYSAVHKSYVSVVRDALITVTSSMNPSNSRICQQYVDQLAIELFDIYESVTTTLEKHLLPLSRSITNEVRVFYLKMYVVYIWSCVNCVIK